MGGSAKFRGAKKTKSGSGNTIYENNYSEERKNNAIWTDDKNKIDDVFRKSTGAWWKNLSDEEKKASTTFTGSGYHNMNKLLGGKLDPNHSGYNTAKDRINALTSALDKSSIPEDIWVRRGVSNEHIKRLFGLSNNSMGEFFNNVQKAIANDAIIEVPNFMSTSATKSDGFSGVEMKIFVPKGSKGVYAEPFSAHGYGDKLNWDGESKQSSFGLEFEVLLQRGYKLKPTEYNPKGGRYGTPQIVFAIVGQSSKPL